MTKIIDCTIRDGGHLNGWNFSEECVKDSYNAAIKAGVDYFEIGYRCDNPHNDWGKFATCEDDFLNNLLIPDPRCKISVMIDAGKCSIEKFKTCKSENTIIYMVRVATYPDRLNVAFNLCENLNEKGYEVILNLMAISKYEKKHFGEIKNWKNKNIIKAICFADSFGSFYPEDVIKYKNILTDLGVKNICFHPHNNLQLAFANSIKALESKFYSLDASVYGMGRGAGILPIELITEYLNKSDKNYNPLPYMELIEKHYKKIKAKTPWGYGLKSLISGGQNLHPYYIKQLFETKNKTISEIWEITEKIKTSAPISFDENFIKKQHY